MNPRQVGTAAALCGTLVVLGAIIARFPHPAASRVAHAAAPAQDSRAAPVAAAETDAKVADAQLPEASLAEPQVSEAKVSELKASEVKVPDPSPTEAKPAEVPPVAVANDAPIAPVDFARAAEALIAPPSDTTSALPQPTPTADAEPPASPPPATAEAPAAETPDMQVATADPGGSILDDAREILRQDDIRQGASRGELPDDCKMADCIDRYLFALYERAPKDGIIKIEERRPVTVKRRGKTVTVMQSFTRVADEDFGWKDPKAAEKAGMPMMNYVIGGMEQSFKLKLYNFLRAAEAAGMSPGITSAFRDDYRQSIASGLKAASSRSFHGGSARGGYGHGLAADVVSITGATRDERWASSMVFWKWIDAHGGEYGIGRPYLTRDPAHVAPTDGSEYASKRGSSSVKLASAEVKKKRGRVAAHSAKQVKKRKLAALRG